MDYELEEETRNRIDEIQDEGNPIFKMDLDVMRRNVEEPFSKIYGKHHTNELYQDLEEANTDASTDTAYDMCERRLEDDGYVLGVDVNYIIDSLEENEA